MVRVVDDLEVRELIRSLRRNLACLARGRIQSSLGTAKGHCSQIAQTATDRWIFHQGNRLLLWGTRALRHRGCSLRARHSTPETQCGRQACDDVLHGALPGKPYWTTLLLNVPTYTFPFATTGVEYLAKFPMLFAGF